MDTIKQWSLVLIVGLLAGLPSSGRAGRSARDSTGRSGTTLFAQSAGEVLHREFHDDSISYLLLDAQTGAVIASRWENPETPIPLGSLVKPFTALAYGEQHAFRYPAHICNGAASGCWLPRGHGPVDLTSAIAYSCNSYFRALTSNLTASEVFPVANRFGLQTPDSSASGTALSGLGDHWRISPLNMARAYLELVRRRNQPGLPEILGGMAESASRGTGIEVDRALPFPNALVKTGTAACTHSPHAPGDGFTIAMVPADQPRILLMVRIHGTVGAKAARTAGQMLRRIQE
jgi:cell division protein FtsI/penicillin-binding protein 2